MKSILPFTSEHEMYRKAVSSYIDKELVPNYANWDEEGGYPREIFKKMGDNGWLCTWVDEKYGGVGGDFLYEYILSQELMLKGINGIPIPLHSGIVVPYLATFGTEEQKERWLPGCVSGDLISAIAMTEPGAGSDLLAMRSRAVKDGDSYIINGSKTFISNGVNCDIAVVAAKTNPEAAHKGVSLFVIENGTPGFSKGNHIPKIGQHTGDTCELFFEDCRVPAANLLGAEGAGFVYLMQKLQQERIIVSIADVFMADRSLELTKEYIDQRVLFGKKLSQFQNTQYLMAELATEVEIGKCFLEQLTLAHLNGENIVKEVSMAKYWLAEMNFRVANKCLQMFGGYGYCKEYEISRQFVDARAHTIFAGASEVMKGIIAKEIGI